MTWNVRKSNAKKESCISIKDYNQTVSLAVSNSPVWDLH